jgi:hypothetical protein
MSNNQTSRAPRICAREDCNNPIVGHGLKKYCGDRCYHAKEMEDQAKRRAKHGRPKLTSQDLLRRRLAQRRMKLNASKGMEYLRSDPVQLFFEKWRDAE